MLRRRRETTLALWLCAALPGSLAAAEVQYWRHETAADFLAGEIESVSVDSFGRLRLAPEAHALPALDAAYVWALAPARDGTVFVATGDSGHVLRVGTDKREVFFDAPEAHVQALALAADGRLFAATSPEGRVYVIDKSGKAAPFFDPEGRYIWALRVDARGALWVACGGPGRLYRVDTDGAATTVLESPESHLTALAVAPGGEVFVGTAPGGIVYRVGRAGDVRSLAATSFKEVRALAVSPDGSLLAAAVMETAKEREAPPPGAPGPPAPGEATVTVAESITVIGAPTPPTAMPGTPSTVQPPLAKGALLRITPDGEIRTLWSSAEDIPFAMSPATAGQVFVGTGSRARVFLVREDGTWEMLRAFPAEQVTALAANPDGRLLVATSNAGRLYSLAHAPSKAGWLTLKVHDAQTVARWGRIAWEGDLPAGSGVNLETRSGNSATPDRGWSEWTLPRTDTVGSALATSAEARFLQIRCTLTATDSTPVVHSVVAAYLRRNLAPALTGVTVYGPGEVFQKTQTGTGDIEILGLAPEDALPQTRPAGASEPTPPAAPGVLNKKLYMRGLQTFSWTAVDPNGDELLFDVEYRPAGTAEFHLLRKDVRDALLAWDTSVLPNGRYTVRVRARDNPGNPAPLALSDELEGGTFAVDNVPPAFRIDGPPRNGRLRVTVRDDDSPIRRVDTSFAGGSWQEIRPEDGLADSLTEAYDLELPRALRDRGKVNAAAWMLRAIDTMGNVATLRLPVD